MTPLPAATLRLFDGYSSDQLAAPEARDFVIGFLLEEGDRHDLAWLGAEIGREVLRTWVEQRGDRQLSRRSRLYWRRVFALATPEAVKTVGSDQHLREALWPL